VSWGTICWLPDLVDGRRPSRRCSNPAVSISPTRIEMLILEERDGGWSMNMRSTPPADRPLLFDEPQTYSGDPTPLTAARTYQWIPRCPRLVNALIGAGLTLEFLHDTRACPGRSFRWFVRGEDGLLRLRTACPHSRCRSRCAPEPV